MSGNEFGHWLAAQLAFREWTPADFARRYESAAGLNSSSAGRVSEWLNGLKRPGLKASEHIADALGRGVTLDDVLVATGRKEPPLTRDLNPDRERIIERLRALPWDDAWTRFFDGSIDTAEAVLIPSRKNR